MSFFLETSILSDSVILNIKISRAIILLKF